MVVAGKRPAPVEQLQLPIDTPPPSRGLPGRIAPRIATSGAAPHDDEGVFFEPWWPGAPGFAILDGGRLRIQTEHLADPLMTMPELRVIGSQVRGDGVVLEGTLMMLDEAGRPDAELLRLRVSGARTGHGEGAFVASDLLWDGGRDITGVSFAERRARLLETLRDGDRCVSSRGLHREGITLADAVARMGLHAISARRLESRWRPGPAGDDWQRISIAPHPAPEQRPLLVLLQRLPLD
jgi:bifunctional non-homologous end joining protein LigD